MAFNLRKRIALLLAAFALVTGTVTAGAVATARRQQQHTVRS